MFTRADFEGHIKKLVADLNIGNVTIRFDFYDTKYVSKRYLGTAKTWRGQTGWLAVVKIALGGHEYSDIVNTLAHELRHVWQDSNGISKCKYVPGDMLQEETYRRTRNGYYRIRYSKNAKRMHTWTGTEYAKAATFSRMREYDRPYEVDARGYADDYIAALTGKKTKATTRTMINKIGGVTFYKFS